METWKQIDGHPDYWVSDIGKVKKLRLNRFKELVEREVKATVDAYGYLIVTMDNKQHKLHRVVCKAFHPNPENKPVVNHIDTNKTNCRASNLEWATHSENGEHAAANGLRIRSYDPRSHVFHHPDFGDFTGTRQRFIETFQLNKTGVSDLIRGKIKHYKGWIYKLSY